MMGEVSSRKSSGQKTVCRVKVAQVSGIMVCVLVVTGLLVWGRANGGKVRVQQKTQLTQGQLVRQLTDSQGSSRPDKRGQLIQSAVTVDRGRLTVLLKEAKLGDVMGAIAHQSGIEINVNNEVGQATITEAFVGLPLEDGLRRLMRGMNYTVVYSGAVPKQGITQVFVVSRSIDQPEHFIKAGVPLAEAIKDTFDTHRFAETVKAAIAAEGAIVGDQDQPTTVDPELNTVFQRVLSGQEGKDLLADQFRRLGNRLHQQLGHKGR